MARTPINALLGFAQAARSRNLSRAAESMNLTVSALSHQIKALEQRLGRVLFERGPRGIELTEEGQRLINQIGPALDTIEAAMKPFRARRSEVLTLDVMPSMASSWLVPRLARFMAAQPEIEINLRSSINLVDFEREPAIDAVLRFGRGQWPGTTALHLFDDWITPTASPSLLRRLGRPTLATLGRFPLLGDPGGRWREWFEAFGGKAPTRFVARFTDSETLHRAAVEGLGIALGRISLARPMIEAGRLVPLFEQRLKSEFSHYLVYPPRSENHAGLMAFRTWVLEEVARDRANAEAATAVQAMARPRHKRRAP
jgi:LysR family glycine cleavage system transcriptional activator